MHQQKLFAGFPFYGRNESSPGVEPRYLSESFQCILKVIGLYLHQFFQVTNPVIVHKLIEVLARLMNKADMKIRSELISWLAKITMALKVKE